MARKKAEAPAVIEAIVPRIGPVVIDDVMGIRPGDNPLWSSPEMYDPKKRSPSYAMHEVAGCFFGRSVGWLRKHLRPIQSTKDGTTHRNNLSSTFGLVLPLRTDTGQQIFRLYDIERLAHALFENGVLAADRFLCTISIVKKSIELWGYNDGEAYPERRPDDLVELYIRLPRARRDVVRAALEELARREYYGQLPGTLEWSRIDYRTSGALCDAIMDLEQPWRVETS